MKTFHFENNWSPKLKLEVLTKLGSEKLFNPNSHLEWIRTLHKDHQNKSVQFRIDAALNDNDMPEAFQLNAIEYILNNETEIYNEIYTSLKNTVYPYYSDLFEEDLQKDFPLHTIEMLPDVLGLIEIQVSLMQRSNKAWCTYTFAWQGEQEHGLSMLFDGANYLKHDSAGEMDFSQVVPEKELEALYQEWNRQMAKKLYYPNPKLRSFKPWQLEKTIDYLLDLLKENKTEEFNEIVSSEGFNVSQKFPEDGFPLLEHVVQKGYLERGVYLFDLGANPKGIMHFGNPYYENLHRIEFINRIGGDIDEKNSENVTLLEKYLNIASREFGFNNMRKIDLYKEHIQLLLKYGATLKKTEKYEKVLTHMNIVGDED